MRGRIVTRRSETVGVRPAWRTAASGIALPLLLTACASQSAGTVAQAPGTPGFLLGLWHGFIFPVAWVLSLFMRDVAIYAVPNNGGWYDFGYFVGIVFLGVGARKTRTVYVSRRVG
jgi:hypothetical protein